MTEKAKKRRRRRVLDADLETPFRELTCTLGGHPVEVVEIPPGHLDPDDYACGRCLAERRDLVDAARASALVPV